MPGKDPGGLIITILIGIAGGVIGGGISTWLGYGDVEGFDLGSLATAVGGALLLAFRLSENFEAHRLNLLILRILY